MVAIANSIINTTGENTHTGNAKILLKVGLYYNSNSKIKYY